MAALERDDLLLRAEQDRQQALNIAAEERSGLQERVTQLEITLDRARHEAALRMEQDRGVIANTTDELRRFRNQLEETWQDLLRYNGIFLEKYAN
ncbi:unnamed protein product [Protopolystoma xenopodis]|uniref:Uncharacterized protein n=1 Tax=Protopolystoma xenopodis TaxID=117903 RepID=A0A3S5B8Z7_9PLAT|nr:unnamed protein product [Protopolystoma xenopodis]